MPISGIQVAIMTGVVVVAVMLFDRSLSKQYLTLNRRYNGVTATIRDYLTNVVTIISLRLDQRVSREVKDRTMAVYSLVRCACFTNEFKWFSASMIVTFTQVFVLYAVVRSNYGPGKAVEVGTIYALFEYLRSIGDAFFQFSWKYGDLVMKGVRVSTVEHILQAYEDHVRPGEGAAELPREWKNISISGLSFTHSSDTQSLEKRRHSLSDVNLTLERGKSYAFVGESGSGKSTMLGILRGIHIAAAAKVECDGQELPFKLTHIAHHTILIPQDPEILADSIRFNLTLGVEHDESEIQRAISLARFDDVLKGLPSGLDTSIAEKGVSLSGGQKQRLALARGLFFVEERGSDFVLLDEPTSSVDLHNERIIYEEVLRAYKNRCVVSAIHKFHLLHLFDEVVVFSRGRIVERGTVTQLLEQNGEFTRLWLNYAESNEERKPLIPAYLHV
jgi:ABC-type multidrug transport system fused ATPase/permease subunit